MLKLKDVAKDEQTWRAVAYNIGARGDGIGDAVQTLYLRLAEIQNEKGNLEDFRYKDGINKAYVFKNLRSIINDGFRRDKVRGKYLEAMQHKARIHAAHPQKIEQKYIELMDEMRGAMDDLTEYDLMILELYFVEGYTMRGISAGTGVSLRSIFNTIKNIKGVLQQKTKGKFNEYVQEKAEEEKVIRVRRLDREGNRSNGD